MHPDPGSVHQGPMPPPSFGQGFASVFFGFRFLLRRPAAVPFALVPVAWFCALSALGVWASIRFVVPGVESAFTTPEGDIGRFAVRAVSWVVTGLVAALGVALALFLSPPLSAPALERLVTLVETERGAPPPESFGWAREMWLGLKASLFGLALFGPLLLLLSLLDFAFPPLALVTFPLRVVLASLWLAYTLFDYPQSLRGYGMPQRMRVLRKGFAGALGFGLACSALFWLPCLTPLVLPAGVIGATELFHRIVESERGR